MAIDRRQFLRRSAIAVAAAGLNPPQLSGAARTLVLEDEWARGAWAFVNVGNFLMVSYFEKLSSATAERLHRIYKIYQD